MKKLCLCQICDCGHHRCPHKPATLWQTNLETCPMITEYTDKFPVYKGVIAPPKSLKPKSELYDVKDKGRMDGTTTTKSDYLPHEVQRRPGRQPEEYKPNPEKIDLGTTYGETFKPPEIKRYAPVWPKEKIHTVKAKMETIPTYKDHYKQWDICKQQSTKPEQTYQPPSSKFHSTTTFQDDFVPKTTTPRESFKPPVVEHSSAPFEGLTSHQMSFIPFPVQPRFVRPRETYKPSSDPLDAITTNQQNFLGLPGVCPQSCKPHPNKSTSLGEPDMPFQDRTENRDRFTEWPVSMPHLRKMDEYVIPTEKMDLNTTTGTNYIRHNVQPYVPAKHHVPYKRSLAPFQNCTTMREDFQAWGKQVRQPIIRKCEEMQKASGKMESLTTFKAHFIPHTLKPIKSFKPPSQSVKSSDPMEDSTMYRIEFLPKTVAVCPASYKLPPGYAFEDSDERGHKYFRKLPSPTAMLDPRPVPEHTAVVVQ